MYFIISIFYLLFFFNCYKANDIIQIPKNLGIYKKIPTKYGNINFIMQQDVVEAIKWPMIYMGFKIEGIKNLNSFNFSDILSDGSYDINGENFYMDFQLTELDTFSPLICKIFYKTTYIDKKIFSIGKYYKYFGGTPKNITKDLNKFTFNKKIDKLSQLKIDMNNGTTFTVDIDKDIFFEIDDTKEESFCFPYVVYKTLSNFFFNDLESIEYRKETLFYFASLYLLNENKKNLFQIQYHLDLGIKLFL
jgi:hypothetical protein